MPRESYEQLFAIVGGVIRRWDPYGLLAGGAPSEEFDHEIALVVARVSQIRTEADSTAVLSAVFSDQFEPDDFSPDKCATVGRQLYTELKNRGFLQ